MDIVISEDQGVRNLHFGSEWVQGAMRIARPYALELEYTREMMAPWLFQADADWPRNALVIGLGVGALSKFLHRHRPSCVVTTVEVEPAVVGAAQLHFKLPPQSPTFRIEVACGADFLTQSTEQFDLILVDGFDHKAKVGPLNSSAFYAQCRDHLSPNGYCVVNVLSKQKDTQAGQSRFTQAFDGQALVLPPCASGNVVALAHAGAGFDTTAAALVQRVDAIKQATALNLKPTASKLKSLLRL
ncbi:fused MFS/spermidine synthase [Limnobacter humi]|uniref:Fused MFS/spermidine synthase n=1 Tax=Limnobacter humi TaxID=1778671 RepID=A0ABT1WF28_9BURK|nr:fused MFS/spermidine synthase [Limnobacter humi]